jgi:hypothetical protein
LGKFLENLNCKPFTTNLRNSRINIRRKGNFQIEISKIWVNFNRVGIFLGNFGKISPLGRVNQN